MIRTTKHFVVSFALIALIAAAPRAVQAAEGYYLQRNLITSTAPASSPAARRSETIGS